MSVEIRLEADLSPHAEAWLRSRGFKPFAEIPMLGRCVDWIATREQRICCVEMKLRLNPKVLQQAYPLQLVTFDVWCFVARKPRKLEGATKMGLGVAWFDGSQVVELAQPVRMIDPMPTYAEQALERTHGLECGGIAGRPTSLGEGPAQSTYDLVLKYRSEKPKASWREVFDCVPNHYGHAKSMQQAMRMVAMTRRCRAPLADENVTTQPTGETLWVERERKE